MNGAITISDFVSEEVEPLIENLCQKDTDFVSKGEVLTEKVNSLDMDGLLAHLGGAGVIPESYAHDSTQEKLYAKYCDALLAKALNFAHIDAHTIDERSDAADVVGKTPAYSIVGDAKAFRLSRTAKNQKDFKVVPLNNWKKGADFACLVAPLYQYPNSKSQIYQQAIDFKVILLSYTHLRLLVRSSDNYTSEDLAALWKVTEGLSSSKSATSYWQHVDRVLLGITKLEPDKLKSEKDDVVKTLRTQAAAQIKYWEKEKQRIAKMTKEEAVDYLVDALKIKEKIGTIRTGFLISE